MDMENMWEQVESGEMPKVFYVYPMHLDARLSDTDKAALKTWVDAAKAKAKTKTKRTTRTKAAAAVPALHGAPLHLDERPLPS